MQQLFIELFCILLRSFDSLDCSNEFFCIYFKARCLYVWQFATPKCANSACSVWTLGLRVLCRLWPSHKLIMSYHEIRLILVDLFSVRYVKMIPAISFSTLTIYCYHLYQFLSGWPNFVTFTFTFRYIYRKCSLFCWLNLDFVGEHSLRDYICSHLLFPFSSVMSVDYTTLQHTWALS